MKTSNTLAVTAVALHLLSCSAYRATSPSSTVTWVQVGGKQKFEHADRERAFYSEGDFEASLRDGTRLANSLGLAYIFGQVTKAKNSSDAKTAQESIKADTEKAKIGADVEKAALRQEVDLKALELEEAVLP
jgi:hypothetical protein